MLDPILHRYLGGATAPLAAGLANRVSANTLTVVAFVAGAAALPAIGYGHPWVGAGLLAVRAVLDGLDGAMARLKGATAFGAYLDRVFDLILGAGLAFVFALTVPDRALAAMFLMLGLVARAAAEGTVAAGNTAPLMGKSELLIAFALACFFPHWFSLIAYAIGILCFASAGLRVAASLVSLRS